MPETDEDDILKLPKGMTLTLEAREDGGLRISSEQMPGLILSGHDPDAVMAKVLPAITALQQHQK